MDNIEIRGAEDLARLTRALRVAGEQGKGLNKEFRKSVLAETKKIRRDMAAGMKVGPALPSRGGLAADIQATTTFRASVTARGVRVVARGKRSIRRMNATGTFRHPVFGDRGTWVEQKAGVSKGFLDRPFERSKPGVQKAILAAIERTQTKIDRSI